ncbi:MAG: flagellar biosynthetic protein FliQ [Firmicutes bacterium]|nr:flagellar biosynthetic protein FliQ [Bacillota bacterium]
MFDQFLALNQSALLVSAVVLLPLLTAALVVGLLVGVFQATTQIQEMTLSFLPKMIVLGVILYVGGPWFLRELLDFTRHVLSSSWQVAYLPGNR